MSLDERKYSLKEKHEALKHEIEDEEKRPHPDDIHLHDLKKMKLNIKDELADM
ncbi:MAG: YdcH family protein [Rhodospirillaceae bacterium]|nr:YdcH family protein [Rhodospirillaceae bacterium]MBT4218906.1 YdcH family protein [Rhodospirillaceae bacterium]MBT4463907.1 YdcH family protein [Rhodospirillaceae bacterium]MBT5013077.1 YdcH family protein [Rhodospirillaceae bacterium]MBT5309233.1 YdcH family protein [Rhodospirillaceae bacterium]